MTGTGIVITRLRDPHAWCWRAVLTADDHTVEVPVGETFELAGRSWRLLSVTETARTLTGRITPVEP